LNAPRTPGYGRVWWVAFPVVALTALAAALRLSGFGESIIGDEVLTFAVATKPRLGDLVPAIQATEDNPPLYYLLAWASSKLGDANSLVRLPSLVFGVGTVPAVYLLGVRTVGRAGALIGAALIALSPWAVGFSTEARAYATMTFFVTLSSLALVIAIKRRDQRSWVLFWLASTLALYSHYTALTILVAQGAWALWTHRDRARPLLFSYAAIAIAFLPWLPKLLEQRRLGHGLEGIGRLFPLTIDSFLSNTAQVIPGQQPLELSRVPGHAAMWLWGCAVGVAVFTVVIRTLARREGRERAVPPLLGLVVLLAFAAPAGVLLYSVAGTDIYIARNIQASLPGMVLLLGALLAALPRPLAIATTLVAMGALVIGDVRALDPDVGRPQLDRAAHLVDSRAGPGDPVVELVFLADGREFKIYLRRPHPLTRLRFLLPDDPRFAGAVRGKRRFFLVGAAPRPGSEQGLPSPLRTEYRLAQSWRWRGLAPVMATEYVRRVRPGG
jgi:mannosyltransferase